MKKTDKFLWIAAIVILVIVVRMVWLEKTHVRDVTHLKSASFEQVENELQVKLTASPEMADSLHQYSYNVVLTAAADEENGVGIIYINGVQSGFRIEHPQYSMYGITIGKSRVGMDSKITYKYEQFFEIDEGLEKEFSSETKDFPVFYVNWTNNDCVVVSCNKATGAVMSVTYYNNAKIVTKMLKL